MLRKLDPTGAVRSCPSTAAWAPGRLRDTHSWAETSLSATKYWRAAIKKKGLSMSGSAGGGGYDYQAEAFASIAAYGLAHSPLDWFDDIDDIPTAIAMETGGPGDDLRIETIANVSIEVQTKHGLQKNDDYWSTIDRFAVGLISDSQTRFVLLVDTTASKSIRDELRCDLIRIGEGRDDNLKRISVDTIARLHSHGVTDPTMLSRVRIIVRDLEHGLGGRAEALSVLSHVVESSSSAATAWLKLVDEGHDLIRRRGRRSVTALLRLLSRHVPLSPQSTQEDVILERYREWVDQSNREFVVPALGISLPIKDAWLRLRVVVDDKDRRPSQRSLARQIEQYHEWERLAEQHAYSQEIDAEYLSEYLSRVVVIGGPGSGKSTLAKRIANRLANDGRTVLKVRLNVVSRLIAAGALFEDAIVRAATDGSGITSTRVKQILSSPNALIADGLDECDPHRLHIASLLKTWAEGHPDCHICVTTRPIGHDPALLPGFEHLELLPLAREAVRNHSKILFEVSVPDKSLVGQYWFQFISVVDDDGLKKKMASLAARNPLLLGFLVRLVIDGVPIGDSRASLYQRIIDISGATRVTDREAIVNTNPTFAACVLDVIGWSIVEFNTPELKDTRDLVVDELRSRFGLTSGEASIQGDTAIMFWEDRRLLERLSAGYLEALVFIHPSIGEFAAARYAATRDPRAFDVWLRRVRRLPRWREVILLLAGLGRQERVVSALLELDDPGDAASTEAVLAAAVISEGLDRDSVVIKNVATVLQARLASSVPVISVEAAIALIPLASLIPEFIDGATKEFLTHEQEWTRLGAMVLSLLSGSSALSTKDFKEWLSTFNLVHPSIRGMFRPDESQSLPEEAWTLQHELLKHGIRRLIDESAKAEVGTFLNSLVNVQHFSVSMIETISDELKQRGLDDIAEDFYRQHRMHDSQFAASFMAGMKRSQQSAVVFLECVLAAVGGHRKPIETTASPPHLSISALYYALHIGETPVSQERYLSARNGREILAEILRVTIAILGLDKALVEQEANNALNYISDTNGMLYHLMTKLVVEVRWHYAKEFKVDLSKIEQGMFHPFGPIVWASFRLLRHGVAGKRTSELLKLALDNGDGSTLYYVSQLAKPIWGNDAELIILNRLQKPLRRGCEYLVDALTDLVPEDAREVTDAVYASLLCEDPHVAEGVAELLDRLNPPLGPGDISRLRALYDHWTERGSRCDHHDIVVKGDACPTCSIVVASPRKHLVTQLAKLGHWNVDDLLALQADDRHDVQSAARRATIEMAKSNPKVFGDLLMCIEGEKGSISLLRDLLALPGDMIRPSAAGVLALLESSKPAIRSNVVESLNGEWIERDSAIKICRNALTDSEPSVRTRAARTLRLLQSEASAEQKTHRQ